MSETLRRQWQTLQLIPRLPKNVSVAVLYRELRDKGYTMTRRTIERDLLTLSKSFSLEVDDSQRPQLWSWQAEALPLDLPLMSQSEALTLLMAKEHLKPLMPASTMTQMARYFGLAEQRIEANSKTPSTAKSKTKASARSAPPESNWRAKVRVLPNSQPLQSPVLSSDCLEAQAVVQEALLKNLQCDVVYAKRDLLQGTAKPQQKSDEYLIHPLGLVQRGQLVYVVCTIKSYSDIKLLATHRLQRAKLTTHRAIRPAKFDLNAYIASGALGWSSESEAIVLKARFKAETAVHLREMPLSKDQVITDDPKGYTLVTASVQLTQQLVWWLLGFGDAVTVLEPRSLRSQMRETIQNMAANYRA